MPDWTPTDIWNYFTKKSDGFARCNTCNKLLSYKSTSANLKNHLRRQHVIRRADPERKSTGQTINVDDSVSSSMDESEDNNTQATEQQPVEKELSVKILSKDELNETGRPGRRTSKVWQVFSRLDDNIAQCNLCSRVLSFKSSVTNLAKHIQRKHPSSFMSLCSEEDPREGLKEFITIEGHGHHHEDDVDDGAMRADDSEWVPPTKRAKSASATPKKVIKKEVISSNGVDYVIYTHDQVTPRTTPARSTKKTPAVNIQRPIIGSSPIFVPDSPVVSQSSTVRRPQVEEDEFATFAKFLSQRIRALKNPYWQSCAINEINSALHRIEMRRYEVPKVDSAQRFAQTDPVDPLDDRSDTIIGETAIDTQHVVEVVHQGEL